MKKKSLVAMGFAGVMTVGMSCSVFADGEVEPSDPAIGTPQVDSKESTVEIIEPITYSVSIPASFTPDTNAITLQVSNVNVEPGKAVKISVDDSNIALTNKANSSVTWNMVLKDGDNPFSLAEFTNAQNTSKNLTLEDGTNDGNRIAGTYQGKVTFKIGYDTKSATP